MSTILPEAHWLMSAGAADVEPARLRELAAPGLHWGRLLALAEYERAFPFVTDRLRESGIDLPPEVARQVRSRAAVAEFSIGRLHGVLEQVVARLEGAGIDVLLLKGAALSRTRYAQRRLRAMGDLDLLIRAAQLVAARDLLLADGWRCPDDPQLDELYRDHHHLPPMHDPRGAGATLELHGDLFFRGNPFGFGAASVWRNAIRVPVGRATAWVPSANHLLLHACIHFSWGHSMREGSWTAFRDVSVLATAADLDWDGFVDEAIEAKATTACYWTLRLASRLMHAPVPDGVLERLSPARPQAVLERLTTHFAARLLGAAVPPVRLERAIWDFAMEPGRCGHGEVRPWDRNDDFEPTSPAAPTEETVADRTLRQFSAIRQSTRCLSELAFAPRLEL